MRSAITNWILRPQREEKFQLMSSLPLFSTFYFVFKATASRARSRPGGCATRPSFPPAFVAFH